MEAMRFRKDKLGECSASRSLLVTWLVKFAKFNYFEETLLYDPEFRGRDHRYHV